VFIPYNTLFVESLLKKDPFWGEKVTSQLAVNAGGTHIDSCGRKKKGDKRSCPSNGRPSLAFVAFHMKKILPSKNH